MRFTPIALSLVLLFSCAEDAELKRTRSLANAGDVTAQFNLGTMYYKGEGVPKDYKEAVKWYRMSADQGNAMAQYHLYAMYDDGTGVSKDPKEAIKWIRGLLSIQIIFRQNFWLYPDPSFPILKLLKLTTPNLLLI